MTCQQTFDNFILTKRLADLSGKTISNYEQFIAPFIDFLGTDRDFERVTQEDIVAYISAMLTMYCISDNLLHYSNHKIITQFFYGH